MVSNKTILVTGGNGFIGKHLVKKLRLLNATVYILDRDTENNIDITDFSQVKTYVNDIKPDYIFHLAAILGKFNESREQILKVNYEATRNLLDCYQDYKRFVYISTSEFYFGNQPPFREDMPLKVTTPYSESKLLCEEYCSTLKDKPITIFRPSIVYGPNQAPGMFLPSLISKCLANEEFDMTTGEQTRDFVYIDDVIEAFLMSISDDNAIGQTFNLGSGTATPLRWVVELVKTLSSSESKINFGALPYKKNELMEYYQDISKIKSVLGWNPKHSLEEGIKKIIFNN